MKRCPYCAEWIQDEAIKCRYCQSDLTAAERPTSSTTGPDKPADSADAQPEGSPEPAATPAEPSTRTRPGEGALRFSHSGYRYVLGYGHDFFGIWGREQPGQPVERFPRTDEGWTQAWNRFHVLEPQAVEVPPDTGTGGPSGPRPGAGSPTTTPAAVVIPPVVESGQAQPPEPQASITETTVDTSASGRVGEGALRFSHSGTRYILGYGQDYFGIWDRQAPGGPIMRFPRTDEGWGAAWNRFTTWEPNAVEVPLTGTTPPDVRVTTGTFRPGTTRATWAVWLLGVIAVLSVVSFSFRLAELNLLQRRERGESISFAEAKANDDRVAGMDLGIAAVGIGTIVAWCMWQHRGHANVRALGAGDLSFSPGWAVGWWFIPFANVVQPFRATRELWKASDPDSGAVDWKARPSTVLLPLWWAAWLLRVYVFPSLAFSAAGGFATDADPTVSQLISRDRFILGGDVATIVAAILAILLVRRITARVVLKAERVAAWRSGLAQDG